MLGGAVACSLAGCYSAAGERGPGSAAWSIAPGEQLEQLLVLGLGPAQELGWRLGSLKRQG